MFYTYVLSVEKGGKKRSYIGSTSNLKKRILEHYNNTTQTTKNYDKIVLIYYEACLNKTDAIIREHQLKTGFGRDYLKRRMKHYSAGLV